MNSRRASVLRRELGKPLLFAASLALVLLFWVLQHPDEAAPAAPLATESRQGAGLRSPDPNREASLRESKRHLPAGLGHRDRSPILPVSLAPKREDETGSAGWIGDIFVRISGNESIPDHRILATLDLPRPYARHRLRQAIEGQIRTFYRGLGYARARVTAVMAASDPFIFDVKIREGRILVYGGLDLKGITAISHAEVTSLYPEQGGRVDWPRIRDANIALRKKYHDVGFAGVIISGKSIVEPSSGQLFYRVRVVEGVHYRVGKVSLPSELGSRFPLSSGDLFRRGQLDEFAQENGLSEEQLRLDRDPVEGVVAITLLEVEGA